MRALLDAEHLNWTRIMGHRQVTDAYLLALATKRDGRFVTFDQRITVSAVPGAQNKNLVVL